MDEANGLSIDATLPKRPLPNVIKEEAGPGLAVSEELSSDDTSICGTPLLVPEVEQIDHMDGYEEEERPTKKQVVIPDTPNVGNSAPGLTELPSHAGAITLASQNGKPKKSKKRSKDVWSSTSRKGKKKTKHASNGKNTANGNAEDTVLITPILRCPDKSDDSPDLKICLSKVHKAEKVELSDDRLSAGSTKGYRMVRATRGVREGTWYFEIKVVCLGETGHTRLGWSTDKADLQAPVGYDGNSFGYRDVDGSKVHKAMRENYGNGYKEGDVIGCYINLPNGGAYAPDPLRMAWYKGQRCVFGPDANADPPKVVPGSEMCYFKNGVCQGTAFKDIHGGQYYPAASMYTLPNQPNCVVTFNFGPNFEAFPDDFNGSPIPRPMIEVPYEVFDGRVENGVSTENKH